MRRQELERVARAHGVQPVYRDWRGRRVRVPAQTLTAILDALGVPARPGAPTASSAAGATAPAVAAKGDPRPAAGRSVRPASPDEYPHAPPVPAARVWGFAVQLYSVRSRESWGHGDLHDLAELARWSARELGAGFVLVNPLHAAEPVPPVSASPYLPMSRRYVSPLYLRVEDVPEYAQLPAPAKERIAALAAPLREQSRTGELIDRDAVWAAKRAALELVHQVPRSEARQASFERFLRRKGESLQDWATWCAIAEDHGPDWRDWPRALNGPRADAAVRERKHRHGSVEFHAWLQWLLDGQLGRARDAALSAGMPIGLVCDLAVGAHPGGADSWAHQDVLATGMSTGAPPDEFNQLGQDWTQPPWHPVRLAECGYRPLHDLMSASLEHAGGLRVDHVMGLFRLWWVPEGSAPGRGAYVRYDHHAMVGGLTQAAARAGAVAIGEDLGTVEPWVRRFLAGRGVLGTSMLWFERRADGTPRPAAAWRRECLATVGTHDMPPAASFLTGEHVALRARLGLLTRPEETERREAAAAVAAWRGMLAEMGLLPRGTRRGSEVAETTAALYAFVARTPARLIAVSLADAVGDRRPQNVPGTSDEYPNWRIPLTDADGHAVLLEDLPGCPGVHAVARAVTADSRPAGQPHR
ncbi:MAG: 4-alpha-glucanotransferase [Micromonosporaceae bacterium]